jgi:hypothetical protein
MAEDWKKANEKRIKDFEAVEKAKKTVSEYDPKEPNKPQWKKDNEARIKAFEAKPKAKAKAKAAEYKMPKSTTPDMDTTQGITGSRNNFDTGEVKAAVKEETKAAPAPIEERSVPVEEKRADKEESRFSSSNPLGMKKGGSVSSASSRADGCAIRGKTRA